MFKCGDNADVVCDRCHIKDSIKVFERARTGQVKICLSFLNPDKAVGRTFCENFSILIKCPRDSKKTSDWFRCKKISQKLKYLNFKCEQSERYFFVLICWRLAKLVSGNQA